MKIQATGNGLYIAKHIGTVKLWEHLLAYLFKYVLQDTPRA